MGKMLRVELTRGRTTEQAMSEELVKKYIGTYGTAARILYDEVPPWVGALDPLNELILSNGPICGTVTPTASRYSAVAKSPLTGYFGHASSGGFFPAEMKFAGYDMIVISGRAERPIYLFVSDGKAEVSDASAYWGMDARQTEKAFRSDLGDQRIQVACIGQAGENLVRYAGIMNDDAGRIAARAGLGAAMGFKRLKAVVVRGHGKVPIADQEGIVSLGKEVNQYYRTKSQGFTKYGTAGGFVSNWIIGDTPSYNWTDEFGEFDYKKVEFPGGYDDISRGNRSCYICGLACRRVAGVDEGNYKIEKGAEGPEYETQAAMGPNCGIMDMKAIAKANFLCNIYGLDTISTGSAIAFAMECYERGLLSKEDTDGMDLKFGNTDALIQLIDKITLRKGFGNILAEGTRRASRIIGKGSDYYAMEVKGQDLSLHDPRAFQGGGPVYATATTGGRHTEGITLGWETGGSAPELGVAKSFDRFSTEKKGWLAKLNMDWRAAVSIMGWCQFAMFHYHKLEYFPRFYSLVTGVPMNLNEMLNAGERVVNLTRAFNVRHGCTRSEDRLPARLLKEGAKRAKGAVVQLDVMLPEYYQHRGWDPSTGIPTKEKLESLGLDDIAEEFWGGNSPQSNKYG
jgi:aldehyde:ferredoxin oxidoreductase